MSTRHLKNFFKPGSIAVIGASESPTSFGGAVVQNLLKSGFPGQLFVVSHKGGRRVYGVTAVNKIRKLPLVPDLAVICSPPTSIPRMVTLLGSLGVRAALVLMGGLTRTLSRSGRPLKESVLAAARPWGIRIMGPNSFGIQVPGHRMNAGYAHLMVHPGKIAFVGQSAVLGSAVVDWSVGHGLGFSHFLTLGDSMDVDLADVIDYLAADRETKALLLHIEKVNNASRLISAIRTAALTKPVLAVKAPSPLGEPAIAAGLSNGEQIWQEVLRRTGVLQMEGTEEMFSALEALNRIKHFPGDRLAIVCNGVGVAMMTIRHLQLSGGRLAQPGPETLAGLRRALPERCLPENPLDLNMDADPRRYLAAIELLARDPEVDAILVIHVPTLVAPTIDYALALIKGDFACPLLPCWLGSASVSQARTAFKDAGLPSFETPERAVEAFMARVRHDRRRILLTQTPPALSADRLPDRQRAREILVKALAGGRRLLLPLEARQLLEAYRVPVAKTWFETDLAAAARRAGELGRPVALKLVDEDHCRPFAYHQDPHHFRRFIIRQLVGAEAVQQAGQLLLKNYAGARPPMGFLLQTMRGGADRVLVSMGMTRDLVFGPVMFCGEGGPLFSTLGDRQVALPPLNLNLARDLVNRTRAARLIETNHANASAHIDFLTEMMANLAQLVTDNPEIEGLEINPFLIKGRQGLVLDVMVALGEKVASVIRPYPDHLSETLVLPRSGREIVLRPIRGEDEPAHATFAAGLSAEAIRYRFFHSISGLSHKQLVNLTQVDYDREMAFIAAAMDEHGNSETLGVVRTWTDSDNISAEFSIVIREDQYGEGLGRTLMEKMIAYCRSRNTLEMVGMILAENRRMKGLANRLGFESWYDRDEGAVIVRLQLNEARDEWQHNRLTRKLKGDPTWSKESI